MVDVNDKGEGFPRLLFDIAAREETVELKFLPEALKDIMVYDFYQAKGENVVDLLRNYLEKYSM